MRLLSVLIFQVLIFGISDVLGQKTISGKVINSKSEALMAVNVFMNKNTQTGTVTDFNGNFILNIGENEKSDSLIFLSFGYECTKFSIEKLVENNTHTFLLKEKSVMLDKISVCAKSVSEEFSVFQSKKIDIYLNPTSSADPLKMLTELPVSTNTDETANPTLRGSSANRSLVYLNQVPVNSPVRNSQLNGIGFFSLFNTAIIKSQNVYASNPPLIYGNSSAGIVEIETDNRIEFNELQLSVSLANIGMLLSRKVKEKAFFHLFGNIQKSDAFLELNKNADIKNFSSQDVGLNVHIKPSKKSSLNVFQYFINEASESDYVMFTYNESAFALRKRYFNILNYKYTFQKHILLANFGYDCSSSKFEFGNMLTKPLETQIYSSIGDVYNISEKIALQFGFSNENKKYIYSDKSPLIYYSVKPDSPTYDIDTTLKYNNFESYLYFKYNPGKKIVVGTGIRKNMASGEDSYISFQGNLMYKPFENHSILFALGRYHSYNIPNYLIKTTDLLQSDQIHLEYRYKGKIGTIQLAGYMKKESGSNVSDTVFGNRTIKGIEIYYNTEFLKYFRFSLSNTFLSSDFKINELSYQDENTMNNFVKTTISYNNTKIFSVAMSYIYHPGKFYTKVVSSRYNLFFDSYQPVYQAELNSSQYEDYHTINITASKLIPIKKSYFILYLSIQNVADFKNQKVISYNSDYSEYGFRNYLRRSIYFGIVYNLK